MSDWLLMLILVGAFSVALYFAVLSGKKYEHHDADSHAVEYAGIIKEGHGPLTLFLFVAYAAVLVFTISYAVQHRSDFTSSGQYQQNIDGPGTGVPGQD